MSAKTSPAAIPALLGIDVGTSGCRAALYSANGVGLASSNVPYPISRPRPRWAEQDVETYWEAACVAVRSVVRSTTDVSVLAIGICGQSPTLVLVDADGQPVRPAIIWQDTRAWQEAERLRGARTEAEWAEIFGMALPVDASYPLARIAWLRAHEPDALARTHAALQPKDFLVHRLTGAFVTDIWSSKGLLHQQTGAPLAAYEDLLSIAPTFAPRGIRPRDIAGLLTEEAADALGLAAGIPVVGGWTDSHVAILASGALAADGRAFDIAGTSEIVGVTATPTGPIGGGVLRSPLWDPDAPERVLVYGPTQTGADALRWAVESLLAIPGTPDRRYETAMAMAASVPPGAEGLVFLPYLDGERTPLWDPHARGVFAGFSRAHTAAHAVRAVLEGVAFAVRHVLVVSEEQAGVRALEIALAGGGIRNGTWNQIKADVLARRVVTTTDPDASVLGAAMLAGLGSGVFCDTQAATDAMVRRGRVCEPQDGVGALYDRQYSTFRDMYNALKPLFPRLSVPGMSER
jgi:xylulokinase